MKGSKLFENNSNIPDKKYDFYQEIFKKHEETSLKSENNINMSEYNNVLKRHKILSGFFFTISFISLTAVCVLYNGSSNVKKEMENNYQEVFATTLNLPAWENNITLTKELNKRFENYKTTAVIENNTDNLLDYKIPSNYNKNGSPVRIEYSNTSHINDTVKYTFSGLDGSPFRVLEKKVLLEKLTNKNFPGYNVAILQEGKGTLIATITRNITLDYYPSYKESNKIYNKTEIKVPPLPTVSLPKPYAENKVEVDLSKVPQIPVIDLPTANSNVKSVPYVLKDSDFID